GGGGRGGGGGGGGGGGRGGGGRTGAAGGPGGAPADGPGSTEAPSTARTSQAIPASIQRRYLERDSQRSTTTGTGLVGDVTMESILDGIARRASVRAPSRLLAERPRCQRPTSLAIAAPSSKGSTGLIKNASKPASAACFSS